jgi:high frequency lysogenization protein
MNAPDADRALALAGVFQAAELARRLAREGRADEDALGASAKSILATEAPDTTAVFGGASGTALGLRILREQFAPKTRGPDYEVVRYTLAMIKLAQRLRGNAEMTRQLGSALAEEKLRFGEADPDDALYGALALVYRQTISTLTPRIYVKGEPAQLQKAEVTDRIRTALLAGVRAAWLWQQLGGRRWQWFLGRGAYVRAASDLLASA